jgi:hypothetical protein
MIVSRGNEQQRTWFRSYRVFLSNGSDWYFQTREGIDVGPYENQSEAEIDAGLLKELLKTCKSAAAVNLVMREFVLDSYEIGRPLSLRFRQDLKASPPLSA